MEQKNGSKKLIDKESVLDIYSDLYDVFDDSPGIINELHKVYDRLNALGSDQHPANGIGRCLVQADTERRLCINARSVGA